jgi:predicted RNase H-like HicB family nuclease
MWYLPPARWIRNGLAIPTWIAAFNLPGNWRTDKTGPADGQTVPAKKKEETPGGLSLMARKRSASVEMPAFAGQTILHRVHQKMLLFAAGCDQCFWRLAQALSSFYRPHTEEMCWVDGVLARKKGLGFLILIWPILGDIRDMKTLQHTIKAVIRQGNESGYIADCVEIAVVTQGETLDEVMRNLREAAALYLEGEELASLGLAENPTLLVTMEAEPAYA